MSPPLRKDRQIREVAVVEVPGLALVVLLIVGQLSSTLVVAGAAETSNPVVVWNQLTTTLGLAHKLQAPYLAHDYVLVHVAMYDALLSNNRTLPQTAIIAAAAYEVLIYLFTSDTPTIAARFNSQVGNITGYTGDQINNAVTVGESAGIGVVAYAQTDGSTATWDGAMPTGPCKWTGSNPVGPVFGFQKTFILSSGREFQPPPPYPCESPQDLADVQAIINAHNDVTPEKIAIVHKWADLPPPTIWNNMLNDRIASHSLSTFDAARASAYLNVGMYDAFVSCWAVKYTYWTARPFQRVPGFVPVITTPNFPSYASGHSVISSAASLIMGQLFPEEADFFVGQASEAAVSRLWGGIHFPQDNHNGFALGGLIGAKVVADMRGATHTFVLSRNPTTIPVETTPSSSQVNVIASVSQQFFYGVIVGVTTVAVVWLISRVQGRRERDKEATERHGGRRRWNRGES